MDASSLVELKSEKLKDLNVEFSPNDKYQCHNIQWVAKLQTKRMSELGKQGNMKK